jgi:hypothetical protein
MIKRVYNADFINSVINHPSVKDGAEVKDIADLSEVAANLNNFILVNEHGGFVVIKKMPGVYECHTQFLPEGRGQAAVDAVNEALNYMFLETDCIRIVTKVNVNNKPVRLFTGQFFKRRGEIGDHYYYSMDMEDWIEKSQTCLIEGRLFHALMEAENEADITENSYIGAVLLMSKNNNVYKGLLAYNRWACMPNYEHIFIHAELPLILQKGNLKIAVQNNEVTVCQQH